MTNQQSELEQSINITFINFHILKDFTESPTTLLWATWIYYNTTI